ncbi:uncharacterized protein [Physcomitrium patens]|uniref:Uncharacterized protein n=1 Tax=Physcomitrium patens TaxID=3218 RepID=A0A2K1L115_PHYPA|nr:hypothetical protein PHYPA_002506 [Physcomitrium patens]
MTNVVSESFSGGGVRSASAESALKEVTALKKMLSKFARSMAVTGSGTEQSPTNDNPEPAHYAHSTNHWEGKTMANRSALPSEMVATNASSPVVKANLLKRLSAAPENLWI